MRSRYFKPFCLRVFWAVCVMACAVNVRAQSSLGRIGDSLNTLYVSAERAGDFFIVDAGAKKALFNRQGRPVTSFLYKELLPGFGGRFAAGWEHGNSALIDSAGDVIANFSKWINAVDTARRQYLSVDYNGTTRFGEDAQQLYAGNGDRREDKTGLFRTYVYRDDTHWYGVVDSAGRAVLPQEYNGQVSLGTEGIVAIRDDTAYTFSRSGKLRFKVRADECRMMGQGVVALKLYGLWGFRDSTGRALTPFKYGHLDPYQDSDFIIKVDNTVLNYEGKELAQGEYNSVYPQSGNWYALGLPTKTGDEIRDEKFNLVFDADAFEKSDFIGPRFAHLYKDYNDALPRVYDRRTRRFTDLKVESYLGGDAYVVYRSDADGRQILKEDKILSLPRFTEITPVERRPFFILTEEERPTRGYLGERRRERGDFFSPDDAKPARELRVKSGLLDTTMRLIVPPKFSGIRILSNELIAASDSAKTQLFNSRGALLATLPGNVEIREEALVVRARNADSVLLLDTMGRVFFRGTTSPAMLYPDAKADNHKRLPNLLLITDSSGNAGLYDRGGKQLLPHLYYPVTQKIAGLISLKKDDSLYYANYHGRLMYGGRGFSGRKYFLLEGYAVLMQNERGKWGVLDAEGRELQPFLYDTAGPMQSFGTSEQRYFVQQGDRLATLDNTGLLQYPLQPWRLLHYFGDNLYLASDSQFYKLRGGEAIALGKRLPWTVINKLTHGHFRTAIEVADYYGGVLQAGIYNRRGDRIAPWYKDFRYGIYTNRIVITDSLKKHVAVIDSNGAFVIPFIPMPARLLVADSGVAAIYRTGRNLLFYKAGGRWMREEIIVDSIRKTEAMGGSGEFYSQEGTRLLFKTADGRPGVASHYGAVLLGSAMEAVHEDQYLYRIRRAGKWGLADNTYLRFIHPPTADSIGYEDKVFRIFSGGLQGLYHLDSRAYLPPRFQRIYYPPSLSNGFAVVRNREGFFVVDKRGRLLTPALDSIATNTYWMQNVAAYRNGEEVSLSIADDGGIRILGGSAKQVKRRGLSWGTPPMVIIQEGDKQGLYSNDSFRTVLPADYDAVEEIKDGGFAAWKYKPNKFDGIDSTIVLDAKGAVLMRLEGWHNPVRKDGYWYLGGENISPVLNQSLDIIVPAGYTATKLQSQRLFVVKRGHDGPSGIVNEAGKWMTPMGLDRITKGEYYSNGYLIGLKTDSSTSPPTKRYSLIAPTGVSLTKPIYDEIRFTKSGILFQRGSAKGYLTPQGKEEKRAWPVEEGDD